MTEDVRRLTHHPQSALEIFVLDSQGKEGALRKLERRGPVVRLVLQQPSDDWFHEVMFGGEDKAIRTTYFAAGE